MPQSPEVSFQSVTVTTDIATTPLIPFPSRGGQVHIPSGSGIGSITWGSYDPKNGTRHAAYTEDGDAIVQGVVAGGSYPIPAALFGCHTLLAAGNAPGIILITQKG